MPDQRVSKSQIPWRSLLTHINLGDLVILIYIVAFARQFFWLVPANTVAWVMTVLVTLGVWLIHLRTREADPHRLTYHFYFLVLLPLLFLFALRVAFPDQSFDTLDYRLINSERALRGLPFIPGDFFPTRFPFNPAPDMVTGITRHLFGYRLGTVINFFALVWAAMIVDRLLRDFLHNSWFRSFAVLVIVLTEQALFVSTNYMVDLLAVPLLLEATIMAVSFDQLRNSKRSLFRIALYLGVATAFKLTNLAFAIPILLLWFYRSFRTTRFANVVKEALLTIAGIVLPLLPFTLFIFAQTGNPVFPLYNKVFKSPFWPTTDFAGVRWGPVVDDPRFTNMHWWEVLTWPILIPFRVEHAAGNLGPEPGRLLVGFVVSIVILILVHDNRKVRSLAFVTLGSALFWSVISGMARYAILINLIGGVLAIFAVSQLGTGWRRLVQIAICAVLVVQAGVSFSYAISYDYGVRPTFLEQPKAYRRDARYFFRDYSLDNYLSKRDRQLVGQADAWIESSALESGVQVLLKPGAPAVCVYMPEYFQASESRARFESSLQILGGRKLFALARSEHLKDALQSFSTAGLSVKGIQQVVIPFYSDHTRIHAMLIEVEKASSSVKSISITTSEKPLTPEGMQAEISWLEPPPTSLKRGQKTSVYVKVKNVGTEVWPALTGRNGLQLLVGNHWVSQSGSSSVNDDGRSLLMFDVQPQAEFEIPITINAPMTGGTFTLEIDLLQENVSWFALKGSKVLQASVKVE